LHWHLTDDQGWRIEIKKYPLLTKVGGYRDSTIIGKYPGTGYDGIKHGGFYTQEQIKEVVAYAAKNYITVIPEIEMPGHASAALAAYPYLGCTGEAYKVQGTWGVFNEVFCAGKDSTFIVMQNILDEVTTLFPSKYIHIGGDECPKESWKKCKSCQARMQQNNLKNEMELQSYFIKRIEKYLNTKGKNIIGWDEILEGGLAPNATVMSWRGEEGCIEAATQNHTAIMTPGGFCYFDHSQTKPDDSLTIGGFTNLEKVYNYNPIPEKIRSTNMASKILGAQANVWTEYITNFKKVEYQIFPRMLALSEVLWCNNKTAITTNNYTAFLQKVKTEFKYLDENKISHLPFAKLQ
jgi:hexosaminidase